MTSGAFRIAQTLALVLTLALSALILDGALPAQAATFTVTRFDDPVPDGCNSGVDCSLREAIIAANAAPGADTIILPAGIYTLAIAGAGDNVAATGDLDITDDLTLTGDGAATTIIDGGTLDRVLDILAGSTVEISGVTVRNGTASPFGGGILNEAGSTLTLTAVAVSGNTSSSSGGGISNLSTASLTLNNSTISGNVGISGGGISNNGSTASLTNAEQQHRQR